MVLEKACLDSLILRKNRFYLMNWFLFWFDIPFINLNSRRPNCQVIKSRGFFAVLLSPSPALIIIHYDAMVSLRFFNCFYFRGGGRSCKKGGWKKRWIYVNPSAIGLRPSLYHSRSFFIKMPPLDTTFFSATAIAIPIDIIALILYQRAIKISPLSLTLPFLAFTCFRSRDFIRSFKRNPWYKQFGRHCFSFFRCLVIEYSRHL